MNETIYLHPAELSFLHMQKPSMKTLKEIKQLYSRNTFQRKYVITQLIKSTILKPNR